MLDNLRNILAYKTLWSLATTTKDGKMTVRFYVSCLVMGREPLWGVWDVNGRFLHFGPGRDAIAKLHPNLAWRRVMARWELNDDEDTKAEARRKKLAEEFHKDESEVRQIRAHA